MRLVSCLKIISFSGTASRSFGPSIPGYDILLSSQVIFKVIDYVTLRQSNSCIDSALGRAECGEADDAMYEPRNRREDMYQCMLRSQNRTSPWLSKKIKDNKHAYPRLPACTNTPLL